jgi:hypothetical protein
MLKRLRWATAGYVLGLATSYAVALRVRRALDRYTTPALRQRIGERLTARHHDLRAAVAEGRAAMAARERELRAARGLDRPRDGHAVLRVPEPVAGGSRPA